MLFKIVDQWDEYFSQFSDEKKDIYFTKGYVSLYEDEDKKALCAVCEDDEKIMLVPFLRSQIGDYYDFESAYGYGGPLSNSDDAQWNAEAFAGIHDCLKENNYICGFTRFHSVLNNVSVLTEGEGEDIKVIIPDRNIDVLYNRQTIAIDTSQSEEEIWTTQIKSKNRNMIRKAEKNGLVFKAEYDFESYEEFISLYNDTMKRLSADSFYFFDDNYYEELKKNFANSSFLGTVRKDGKLICAAIFFYSKCYGHYHLEGSDREYSSLGANNFLLWKVACEMHKLGIKEFHLGGGATSEPDDRLFKFKKSFSSNEKMFYIGKQVFNEEVYKSICEKWEKNNPEKAEKYGKRLLRYRL